MKKLLIIISGVMLMSYATPAEAWYHHHGYGWGWGPAPLVVERGPVVVERSPVIIESDPVIVHDSVVDRIGTLRAEIRELEVEKDHHPWRAPEINSEERALRREIRNLE